MFDLSLAHLQWFHWAALGLALMLCELVVPAFVLVWFGLGALVVAGLTALAAPAPEAQGLVWIAVSLVLVALWFKLFRHHQTRSLSGRASAEAVGEVGLLTAAVAPFQKGSVRFQRPVIGMESWDCIADDAIAAGARVRVVSVEGSLLKIAALPHSTEKAS